MVDSISEDWKPLKQCTLKDQGKAFDKMREQCPVAHSNFLGWYEDIAAVEEILRVDGPLVANPRTTTREVKIKGRLEACSRRKSACTSMETSHS